MAETPSTEPVILPTLSIAELHAEFERRPLKPGQIVPGQITALDAGQVTVTLDGEAEPPLVGTIPLRDFTLTAEMPDLAEGQAVEVYLEAYEGDGVVLSASKALRLNLWEQLHEARKANQPVSGRGLAVIRGGLSVDIGVKATLAPNRAELPAGEGLESLIGQTFDVWIARMDERKGQIQLARTPRKGRAERPAAPVEGAEGAAEGVETPAAEPVTLPAEGDVLTGVVKSLVKYGAFVQIAPGLDGLLHITDMSWGRVDRAEDVVQAGDEITVKVISVKDADNPKNRRVKLSLKAMGEDPWHNVGERFPDDSRVKGRVVGMTRYGAFLEVEPGVEGLVHVSEMSWSRKVNHPSDMVSTGETVEALVLGCDPDKRRLSLSLKLPEHNPWHGLRERLPVGTRVLGPVRRIADFGLFVGLEEGIDGLVHVNDLAWLPSDRDQRRFKKGTKVEALVLNVDEAGQRVSLGIKHLTPDPTPGRYAAYSTDQVVEGVITSVRDFGAFLEVEPGVEGLIHTSEQAGVSLSKGDKRSARVISVEPEDRRLGLTLKGLVEASEEPPAQTADAEVASTEAADAETASPETASPDAISADAQDTENQA